jgi:hypothetical protein
MLRKWNGAQGLRASSVFVALLWMICGTSARGAAIASMDDIQFWTGSGANRAALVIDWNDGKTPESIAWGFRWNGVATGKTMLDAILAADPRLTQTPGGGGPGTVYGLGYDVDGDGFSITGSGDTATPSDPDDHYRAGWFSAGFWSYWGNNSGDPALPNQAGVGTMASQWSSTGAGYTSRVLVNNGWDGWSFAPNFSSSRPGVPVSATPIPEPVAMAAAVFGAGAIVRRRRAVFRMNQRTRSLIAACAAALLVMAWPARARAQSVADAVVSYDSTNVPTTFGGQPYDVSGAALGLPQADTTFGMLTPFNAAFDRQQIVGIGFGGSLVLHLSQPVATTGRTLGVHAAAGLGDYAFPNGQTGDGSPTQPLLYTDPRDATVSVSQDGVTWKSLGAIEFDIPTNYYAAGITTPGFQSTPGTTVADFSKPFLSPVSAFASENWSGVLNTLNGSAGGQWLDLSGTGLSSVNYVRFDVTAAGEKMYVDSVVGIAVPEPGAVMMLGILGGIALLRSRRTKHQ